MSTSMSTGTEHLLIVKIELPNVVDSDTYRKFVDQLADNLIERGMSDVVVAGAATSRSLRISLRTEATSLASAARVTRSEVESVLYELGCQVVGDLSWSITRPTGEPVDYQGTDPDEKVLAGLADHQYPDDPMARAVAVAASSVLDKSGFVLDILAVLASAPKKSEGRVETYEATRERVEARAKQGPYTFEAFVTDLRVARALGWIRESDNVITITEQGIASMDQPDPG